MTVDEWIETCQPFFTQRFDSLENIGIGILVATSLTVGAILALLVMRFFHVR